MWFLPILESTRSTSLGLRIKSTVDIHETRIMGKGDKGPCFLRPLEASIQLIACLLSHL